MTQLERFESYITGDFSNHEQVELERAQGEQKHPMARHVNRKIDDRIDNLPEIRGFFILEESYYEMNGKKDSRPHIFCFQEDQAGRVVLYSYKHPERISQDELKNDNCDLRLDYQDLELSPFQPLTYTYQEGIGFIGESISDFGEGRVFRLAETIGEDSLQVMEEMKVNGEVVTPYATPILYRREQNA